MESDMLMVYKLYLHDKNINDDNLINEIINNYNNKYSHLDFDEYYDNLNINELLYIHTEDNLYEQVKNDNICVNGLNILNSIQEKDDYTPVNLLDEQQLWNNINNPNQQQQQPINNQPNYYNIFNIMNNLMTGNILDIVNEMYNAQNQEDIPVVLTEESFNKLNKVNYEKLKTLVKDLEDDQTCTICLDKLKPENNSENTFLILPCSHYFHQSCIKEYLTNYNYHCPICKAECGEHYAKL